MGLRSPTTANVQVRLGRTQLGYAQPRIKTNLQNDKNLCLAKFEKYTSSNCLREFHGIPEKVCRPRFRVISSLHLHIKKNGNEIKITTRLSSRVCFHPFPVNEQKRDLKRPQNGCHPASEERAAEYFK